MYEMKPEYLTGIDFIDQEHEKLFEIANRTYNVLIDEFIVDKYDYIIDLVNELKDYAKYHFAHEEEYMSSISYKKLLSHKVTHNDFIDKLDEYQFNNIDENQKETLLGLLDFLNTWLVSHIYKSDKMIAE
ncbi:MAG: hemerythrin-like metal-binding protein [Herbinix sp.]|jgi:hemerythrin|nr:hemerythrin-like metal-binding protein [Herbinix sp.]